MPRSWILTLIGLTGLLAAATPAVGLEGVGVTFGLDRTKLTGDEPQGFRLESGTGFKINAVIEFALGDDVVLSLQPGYVRAETELKYKDKQAGVVRDSLSLDTDAFDLPIILRVETMGAVYATGGLDLSFLAGGDLTGGAFDVPTSSFLKDVDVAAIFGVGLTFPVGRYELTGELRYRQGLVNMARESLGGRLDTLPPRFRFAGFQLQVGLMLPWRVRR